MGWSPKVNHPGVVCRVDPSGVPKGVPQGGWPSGLARGVLQGWSHNGCPPRGFPKRVQGRFTKGGFRKLGPAWVFQWRSSKGVARTGGPTSGVIQGVHQLGPQGLFPKGVPMGVLPGAVPWEGDSMGTPRGLCNGSPTRAVRLWGSERVVPQGRSTKGAPQRGPQRRPQGGYPSGVPQAGSREFPRKYPNGLSRRVVRQGEAPKRVAVGIPQGSLKGRPQVGWPKRFPRRPPRGP
jgi:hypothetical protein